MEGSGVHAVAWLHYKNHTPLQRNDITAIPKIVQKKNIFWENKKIIFCFKDLYLLNDFAYLRCTFKNSFFVYFIPDVHEWINTFIKKIVIVYTVSQSVNITLFVVNVLPYQESTFNYAFKSKTNCVNKQKVDKKRMLKLGWNACRYKNVLVEACECTYLGTFEVTFLATYMY